MSVIATTRSPSSAVSGSAPARKDEGLPDDAFVYCSFNNNHKFTPEVFDVWMRLLQRVPGSVLPLRAVYILRLSAGWTSGWTSTTAPLLA